MKNLFLLLSVSLLLVLSTGCSSTWGGVKQDVKENVDKTKEVIHKATE
jgi:hypothetical protein